MSSAPILLPGPERESPFDVATIRKFVTDLLVHTADEVESEQLEIKGWCNNERELAEKVAEAASCIANTSGGYVLVGVGDGSSAVRKFSACPHNAVSTNWLLTSIHNLTKPPVECAAFDVSPILAEATGCVVNNLYAVRVPKTRSISGHVTTKGVSKVRVGKQCQPQYLSEDDRTSVGVPGISVTDLSASSIGWAIGQHQKHFTRPATWANTTDFLTQARLIEPYLPDEEYAPQFNPTLAALLLFGESSAIQRCMPFFETVAMIDDKHNVLRMNIIESVKQLCIGETSILRSRLPQIPSEVLKELVVNAYIHRCYRTASPVVITVSESGLEIRSPGDLLSGLSVTNLINGVPVYRNLLLADGARFVGLCDKIGQGIDLIFKGVLTGGLGFPEFESGNNLFVARIPLPGSAEFKEFLRKRSQVLNQLDEVIALRVLWSTERATLEELCSKMQRKIDFSKRVLEEMRKKNMIQSEEGSYSLTAVVRRDIETIFQSDQMQLPM